MGVHTSVSFRSDTSISTTGRVAVSKLVSFGKDVADEIRAHCRWHHDVHRGGKKTSCVISCASSQEQ